MKFQCLFFITVVLLSLSLHGFAQAQEAQERPIVKLIYFLPSDRAQQPDFDAKMDTLIKDVQALFANQMEAHGFDRKTFLFETDTHGKAVVHHFVGQFTEEYYNNLSDTWDIFEEINKQFDTSKDIYIVAIDTSLERVIWNKYEACGVGSSSGQALVPAAGHCFSVYVVAHELGHVFGLWHGYYNDIDNKRIFSDTRDYMLASFWAADWWDVHPAFNPPRPAAINEYQHPTVEMLVPSLAAPPNVIRLRFEITDPNERLHQAQLMTSRYGNVHFLAGQRLNGKPSEIVEFVTPELTTRDQNVWLQMIDVHGNITQSQRFPIDITPLLPPSETFATVRLNKGKPWQVAYSPDGLYLAVAGALEVWLYDTKIDVPPVPIESTYTTSISFSPDGQTLAIGSSNRLIGSLDGSVRLWDVRTRELGRTLELTTVPVDVSLSPDGRLLAIAGLDGTIYFWDVMTGERRHTIEHAHSVHCSSVSFSPDGQTLASGGSDNIVRLWDVSTGALRHTLTEHTGSVNTVAFSPDGKTLASGSHDATVRLWDVSTGEPRQELGHRDLVLSVSFSPDGKTLASASFDHTIGLWDVSTGERRHTLHGHTYPVLSISFRPDGKTLASVSREDSTVNIWDVMTGELRQELTGYSASVQSMSFSPDSETLATVGDGKTTIDIWDVSTTELRHTLTGHTRPINTVSFSPDGKTIASAASDSTVRLWDVSTGALRHTLTGDAGWVNIVSFSPDGKTIASADDDLRGAHKKVNIYLWDVITGERRHTLIGHTDRVTKVSFRPDGKTLTSVSLRDDTIRVWDVMTGEPHHINSLIGYKGGWAIVGTNAKNASFSPDGKMFACVSGEGDGPTRTIYLWDVMTGELRQELNGHTGEVWCLSFSPDGKTLASASFDHTIGLWDVSTGERRHTLHGHTYPVLSISFRPDGKTLASVSREDSTVNIWDVMTGELRQELTGYSASVQSMSFSPDSETLATVGDGKTTIDIWDVSTTELRHTLTGHTRPINTVSFSPDGKTIASAASDSTVRLWDVSTGALRHTLTGDAGWVNIVSFSPDGKTIASADDDLRGAHKKVNIYLWDVITGERRHTLIGHTDRVTKVSFRPDGKTLTSVSLRDDTIRVWDVMTGEPHHINSLIGYKGGWVIAGTNAKNTSFSPDGKMFACVSGDSEWKDFTRTIYLWDVMTGELRQELTGHTDSVPSLSFSPDGKTLASASLDATIGVWDVMTGERRHTLRGHINWVQSISFSPDGKTLASGGLDQFGVGNTVDLWDAESGEFRHTLITGTHLVLSVLFSPDGQTLAIIGGDSTISLWKVPSISSEPEKIKEDINTDGIVNIQDLVTVAAALGQTGENAADVNGDGEVNIQDLVAVAAAIGEGATAPAALRQQATAELTAADVQQWIELAQQLDLTAPRTQRGVLFLQYLLAALTPQETLLLANYPNPFNPETWIPYQLATPADVSLTIYDINGRVVRDLDLGHQRAGMYQSKVRAAYWDGRNAVGEPVASGIYFYTLTAGDFAATRKMLIRK